MSTMKNSNLLALGALMLMCSMVSSCAAIAGIFEAGMGFGIFIVIAIVILVLGLIMRSGKSKSS